MLIHCKIKREGPTTVILENTKYMFMPIPGSKKGEMTTSVAEVNTQRHVDHLLKLPMYEEYDQEKVAAELKREKAKPDLMKGFAIEKAQSGDGYVCVDKSKKPYKYAGESGQWVAKDVKITPFKSEMEAFNFLKADRADDDEGLADTLKQLT